MHYNSVEADIGSVYMFPVTKISVLPMIRCSFLLCTEREIE